MSKLYERSGIVEHDAFTENDDLFESKNLGES
jgi:hypothetical protein